MVRYLFWPRVDDWMELVLRMMVLPPYIGFRLPLREIGRIERTLYALDCSNRRRSDGKQRRN